MSNEHLYKEAVAYLREYGKVSTAALQRRFRIGYAQAAKLIEDMEANGVVSKQSDDYSRPRRLL